MNLLFNILLAAGLIALCHSACEVCNCATGPPTYTEAYFNDVLLTEYEQTETRHFVPVTEVKVVDCEIVLVCDFPVLDEEQTNVQGAVGNLGKSTGFNLQGTNCVNGSQWHSELEGDIEFVGCYVSISKF